MDVEKIAASLTEAQRRGPGMSRRYRIAMALLKLAEFVRPGTLGELGEAYIAVTTQRRAALRTILERESNAG